MGDSRLGFVKRPTLQTAHDCGQHSKIKVDRNCLKSMSLTPLRWLRRSFWASGLLLGLMAVLVWVYPVLADELNSPPQEPAQLFEVHCAGCHPNGGNIIRRGKTLRTKALKRYGYTEVSAVADIIANGKGIMSAYRDRLTDETIHTLATYVLEQADTGW